MVLGLEDRMGSCCVHEGQNTLLMDSLTQVWATWVGQVWGKRKLWAAPGCGEVHSGMLELRMRLWSGGRVGVCHQDNIPLKKE